MITIDFDTAHTPSGQKNESVIMKCGKIRTTVHGTIIDDGELVIEDLSWKPFRAMIRRKDIRDHNAIIFDDVRQIILLPNTVKDWTKAVHDSHEPNDDCVWCNPKK